MGQRLVALRSKTPRLLLAIAAAAVVLLFTIAARHALPFLQHGVAPSDLGYSPSADWHLQLVQTFTFLLLMTIYGLTLQRWSQRQLKPSTVLALTAVFAGAACSFLPSNSTDVFEYLGFGRLVALYHLNPYAHTYTEIIDGYGRYVTWDAPMPYGAAVLPIFAIAGWLSKPHVLLGVYALKAIWAALHVVNTWFVYRIATALALDAGYAAFLFGCNPLILFEESANGHNDGVLIFCALAALWLVQRRRGDTALVIACIGTLFKPSGLVWLSAIAVLLARDRQWRLLARGAAGCMAVTAFAGLLVPGSIAAVTSDNSQWSFSEDSLHTIAIGIVQRLAAAIHVVASYDTVFTIDRVVATLLFAATWAWCLRRIDSLRTAIDEVGWVLLTLLLAYAASVEPWYAAWLLPVAALTESTLLRQTILVCSAAFFALYAFPFNLVEVGPSHHIWAALRLGLAFVTPIAYFLTKRLSPAADRQPAGLPRRSRVSSGVVDGFASGL